MESAKSTGKATKILLIVIVVIAMALAGLTYYFYNQVQNIKKNPNIVSQAEVEHIVSRVGQLIDLPKEETPTLYTVQDKEKLKDQLFFANAQNGDKILVYIKAKKAIVYRPKDNKLINVGPITIDPKSLPQVALIDAGGDLNAMTKKIADKFPDTVSVSATAIAKNRNSIKQVTVVDVTGQSGELAKQIAAEVGGAVGPLPAGELAPEGANILVYVK